MGRHICVSVATRERPKMLANLLASLRDMTLPAMDKVSFLIVENKDHCSLGEIVDQFRSSVTDTEVAYFNQGKPGICAVRNFALNYTVDKGYDFLVYVDDDEQVHKDWLINLLAERDRLDLDIVGSPVRPIPFGKDLSLMQKIVWSGIKHSSMKSERKCKTKALSGQGHTIKIATGSWMGRLSFFRETGLRFDQRFDLSGGEDWNLWATAKSLGAETGWAHDAIVYETVPASRLTLAYHFRRNRDHNITEFSARYRENPVKTVRGLPIKLTGRTLKFFGAVCAIPFLGSRGLVSSAAALGGLIGQIQGCCGVNSEHYQTTTGF
ncbi:glycosyl transferase family A [Ochrobactrum sp. MYb15]|uniref:glycosyltransferase family 2 protein n=1 Tax=Brucella pituitosa TaxID=571256 RepID=UPI000CFC2D85|nr:glycosyl transferase family A [Ochrobactrum sp. MYb19]PRA63568.1 glycosyl transferase family A [Ochrobactrum sp. MYb18]PRA73746.1 glycosyl transferase family A [Brucella thiophenivorans]PRA86752.1 glycosyl transferase family A [Ochrobactrum sp. MYb14]PRA95045.1 glycosyl transferase family A [Ochrobactrum sp. MYb15]